MGKILIIESDKEAASRAEDAIKSGLAEVDIHVCLTGSDGLKCLKKRSFDLVVCESGLTDMTGFELLLGMAEIGGYWPVIIISSTGMDDEVIKYMRAGVYDYIVKNSEYLQTLPDAVQRALGLSHVFNEKRNIVETNIEQERHRELSKMAHILTHEVNNPLMTIIGNVQLLLSRPEVKPGELREKLAAIEDSAQRIARVMAFFANRNNEHYNDLSPDRREQGLILKRT